MFISVNGKIQEAASAAILAGDRSYRYGDGLFETMKCVEGAIQLADLHLDRLFSGMEKMKIEWPRHFGQEQLLEQVKQLCKKNEALRYGRVRLSVSAGEGGLFEGDRKANHLIEAWPLSLEMAHLNSNGLTIGIYPDGQKAADSWSNLKSSSALLYSMAAIHAKEQHWNDAIVLNSKGSIADSCIANVFIVKDGKLYTPALTDGCVAGVLRRLLLEQLPAWGYTCEERSLSKEDLLNADELFLTNAIRGIRWVKELEGKQYANLACAAIYKKLQTIWK